MNLAIILFLGGAVVIVWIVAWSRLHRNAGSGVDYEQMVADMPMASTNDAVLVAQEHGRLIYANNPARKWLGLNGEAPHLEHFARAAEPSDSFLELFSREAQSSFQIGKRWVEASSHRIPTGIDTRTVVVMRELTSTGSGGKNDVLDMSAAMTLINQIGETVNASMGVEQVLQALLGLVRRCIDYDGGEIALWNEDEDVLYQRGWVGDAMYLIALAEAGGKYERGEGITGWVAQHQQPIIINNRSDFSSVQPKLANNPYQSFIAVPLKLGGRFIGTLEVTSVKPNAFKSSDMALLQAVSTPIAVNIYNAGLYADQVKRVDDLATLQEVVTRDSGGAIDEVNIYTALNQRVAELMSADMCGVFLYDQDRMGLIAQPPFLGLPEALVRTLFIPLPQDSPQRDIWEKQSYWVSNDVVDEPLVEALGLQPIVGVAGITNTAWIPLQVTDRRIGVIVVSNKRTEGGFTSKDIQNLTVLAAQATIVIENLRLYQREQRMDTELVGLQELTNAIGALSHESEFYGEITERIARLMNIEMCGILLYDESTHRLRSKLPFYGISEEDVADYEIHLAPGTILAQLWEEEQYWYSNRVQSDTLVFEASLDALAEKLNVQKTMMATLLVSNRRIGAVQISNKLSGEDFTDSDARLLMIFATQAAAIIENARLYREAQDSAEQAQGLRRVAELAGNVLTTQETFTPILAEIARLLNSEVVYVNVLDQQAGKMITYPRWVHGVEIAEPLVQDIYDPGFEHSVAVSHRPFISNDVLNNKHIIKSYLELSKEFGLRKSMLVPLVFGDRTLGELGVSNRIDGDYTREDLDVLQIVASQVAAALDRLLLYEETGQNLTRRMDELDAISRISNELTVTLDLDHVLNVIREEAVKATNALDCTIALLTPQALWQFPDRPRLRRRVGNVHGLPQLAEIEVEAVMRGADTVEVADYEFSNLMPTPSSARSAIAAAILYLDQVVGVIHLYHDEANRFDERAAAFLLTLAVKCSLAYGNSVRYQEQVDRSNRLRRRVDQLNQIFELGNIFRTTTETSEILEAIAFSVQQSVGYDTVVILMRDDNKVLHRITHAGLPLQAFEESRSHTITEDEINQLFKEKYQISESYFFPIEEVGEWYVQNASALSTSYDGNRTVESTGRNSWRDGDLLAVPMRGADGELIGVISVDRPYDNHRPDRTIVEVLEIFAHQAAGAIENTRLYLSSVRSAEQEAEINKVLEAASSTLDVTEIVASVARGIRQQVSFSRMTVAVAATQNEGYDLMQVTFNEVDQPEIARTQQIIDTSSVLYRTITDGQDYVYREGEPEITDYDDLQSWHENGEKLSFVIPLLTGGQCLGAIHVGSDTAKLENFEEARLLLNRMAQLVASSVQNARLFNQAVDLQVLNRSVLESIQQGIIVLDNASRIISANSYMGERYGWGDTIDYIGKELFEYRPPLAEFMEDDLKAVLSTGAPQERIRQTVTTANDEPLISNFYLYPLRSENVVRGAVILVEDVTERSQLEQQIEARANQLGALTDVSTRVTASLEREEVVRVALEEMAWLIDHDGLSLWRRNGSYMVLEGAIGQVAELNEEGDIRFLFSEFTLTKQVVESQRVVSVGNRSDLPNNLPVHKSPESWMGVPLVNQGHVVGMMMLTSALPNQFDSISDQNIAFAFASQVAIAEANADLFEQTFDRTNELGTLLEAANATALSTDLDSVFRTVVELMFSALEMDDCAIMIWDEVDNELEVQVDMNRYGLADRITPKGTRFDLTQYPAKSHALRDREVVVITIDDEDTPYTREWDELQEHGDTARMLVPLVVRETSIGLIQLEQTSDEEIITQQKVRLARALGTQVAIAIENARLSAQTTAQFEESLIINDLSRAISGTLELQDMIDVVADQVPSVTSASELYLALYHPERDEITFPVAVRDGERYVIPPRSLGDDEVSFIIKNRRPLTLGADYFSPDELRRSLGITNNEGDVKSYLGVPLIAGDVVNGVLAVRDRNRTRAFTVNEQRILTTVASQLGAAIQNARLFEQTQDFAQELEAQVRQRTFELEEERDRIDTLYQITSELARTLDMERLMPRALGMVAKAVAAHDGVIMQLDPITDQLYSRAALNPNALQENPYGDHALHPAERLARWLIEEDEAVVLVEDLHEADYWDKETSGAEDWRSALAVLLETNDELLGVMVLLSQEVSAFEESHLRLMVAAANQVASSINNAELYKLIRDQAERLGSLLRSEQEETEKNRAILESIADGVVLSDAEGNIILFNNSAERILQVPRDQAIGQSLAHLTGVEGGKVQAWNEQIERRFTDVLDLNFGEYISDRLDIGERIVDVQLSPVFTGEKFLGTVSVFRDITREVTADRSKNQFIENVSHEFRTPLTPIKGFIDMVLMGAAGDINDQQKNILGTVKNNVDRLAMLVDDVLEISRVGFGQEQLNLSDVNLVEIIERSIENVRAHSKHRSKDLNVMFKPPADLPNIEADYEKVLRVVNNLVDNAFNYTPSGGSIDITVKPDHEKNLLMVSVTDTGVGIPKEFYEHIWQRFERHDETALSLEVAGTGLGLAIVREMVNMHGGNVGFESEVGVGSTFYFSLPIQQPDYMKGVATLANGSN